MKPTDIYISHPLNTSKSKQTHLFPKEARFSNRLKLNTEAIYSLPAMREKRTTGFGYGSKTNLTGKSSSPPPGSYQLPSQFQKTSYNNTASIAPGRDHVSFGSFLLQALKRSKDMPSPDRYKVAVEKSHKGGGIGQRIKTDYEVKYKRSVPGPGSYQLKATEMTKGNYFLSTFKNNTSLRYFPESSFKSTFRHRSTISAVSYDVSDKTPGRYPNSKYKNISVGSFAKSKREGIHNKHCLGTPGFKYKLFSEFGTQ